MAACEAIPEDARLWRRVSPISQAPSVDDPSDVVVRGDAFRARPSEDGTSVDLAAVHEAANRSAIALLDGMDDTWGVAEITMKHCRDLECHVVKTSGDPNDAHAEVIPRPNKRVSRELSLAATWAVKPRWPR